MAERNHSEEGPELNNTLLIDQLLDDAPSFDRKVASPNEKASALEIADEKQAYLDPGTASLDSDSIYSDTVFVNGEPVVTTGKDVSRFVVDLRDDGDPSLTFRSLVLGTVFAGLGAALCQVCLCSSYMERS